MTDDDKTLVERLWLAKLREQDGRESMLPQQAADRIEAQAAEIETMVPRDVAETWKAKAENLSAALKATAVSNAECLKTVAGLKEEIERLREAGTKLRGYAEHDDNCSSGQRWQTSPCNCGYIDAWKQWDAALGETK